MILGVGIDIVKMERIRKILDSSRGAKFCERIFSPLEIDYAKGKKRPYEHFAGFFAIKESFMKALGTGWRKGIKFCDIQISHNKSGAPLLKLEGTAKELLEKINSKNIFISLSHDDDHAIGIVIIEG